MAGVVAVGGEPVQDGLVDLEVQVAAGEPYEYNDLKDCDNELCAPSGNRHRCHRCNPQFKLCLDEVESLFSRTSSS